MKAYSLEALGMVNSLGRDQATIYNRLVSGETHHLGMHQLRTVNASVPVGRVSGDLASLPDAFIRYNCRNHTLAYMAFLQIENAINKVIDRYGMGRIGVVLGSSTSGLDASESAYFTWKKTGKIPSSYDFSHQHDMSSISRFIAELAGVSGPCYTLSTACSSSAKVFASAKRLIEMGICDAVITGGVDALCNLTLDGFESLGSLSRKVSNPMSANRDGLNIGEGAALFVMTKEQQGLGLLGVGESCDAYHMSAPHPEGLGAEAAMVQALVDAELGAADIAYLNLHGTGTPLNDMMEGKAVDRIFKDVLCSSTKPLVGHCLGVAGAMEIGFCWLVLNALNDGDSVLPPHRWDGQADPRIPTLNLTDRGQVLAQGKPAFAMSSSYAFGGNNCSVIIGNL